MEEKQTSSSSAEPKKMKDPRMIRTQAEWEVLLNRPQSYKINEEDLLTYQNLPVRIGVKGVPRYNPVNPIGVVLHKMKEFVRDSKDMIDAIIDSQEAISSAIDIHVAFPHYTFGIWKEAASTGCAKLTADIYKTKAKLERELLKFHMKNENTIGQTTRVACNKSIPCPLWLDLPARPGYKIGIKNLSRNALVPTRPSVKKGSQLRALNNFIEKNTELPDYSEQPVQSLENGTKTAQKTVPGVKVINGIKYGVYQEPTLPPQPTSSPQKTAPISRQVVSFSSHRSGLKRPSPVDHSDPLVKRIFPPIVRSSIRQQFGGHNVHDKFQVARAVNPSGTQEKATHDVGIKMSSPQQQRPSTSQVVATMEEDGDEIQVIKEVIRASSVDVMPVKGDVKPSRKEDVVLENGHFVLLKVQEFSEELSSPFTSQSEENQAELSQRKIRANDQIKEPNTRLHFLQEEDMKILSAKRIEEVALEIPRNRKADRKVPAASPVLKSPLVRVPAAPYVQKELPELDVSNNKIEELLIPSIPSEQRNDQAAAQASPNLHHFPRLPIVGAQTISNIQTSPTSCQQLSMPSIKKPKLKKAKKIFHQIVESAQEDWLPNRVPNLAKIRAEMDEIRAEVAYSRRQAKAEQARRSSSGFSISLSSSNPSPIVQKTPQAMDSRVIKKAPGRVSKSRSLSDIAGPSSRNF